MWCPQLIWALWWKSNLVAITSIRWSACHVAKADVATVVARASLHNFARVRSGTARDLNLPDLGQAPRWRLAHPELRRTRNGPPRYAMASRILSRTRVRKCSRTTLNSNLVGIPCSSGLALDSESERKWTWFEGTRVGNDHCLPKVVPEESGARKWKTRDIDSHAATRQVGLARKFFP